MNLSLQPQPISNQLDEVEELHYASVQFFRTQTDPVYCNVNIAGHHRYKEEEEEDRVEYSAVKFNGFAPRWASLPSGSLSLLNTQKFILNSVFFPHFHHCLRVVDSMSSQSPEYFFHSLYLLSELGIRKLKRIPLLCTVRSTKPSEFHSNVWTEMSQEQLDQLL